MCGSISTRESAGLVDQIMSEGPLGMSAIARLCRSFRGGVSTHPSTPPRWHTKGVVLADGRVGRLEAVRVNGRLISSRAALLRFIEAQQGPSPTAASPPTVSPTARKQAAAAASAELDRLGIRPRPCRSPTPAAPDPASTSPHSE